MQRLHIMAGGQRPELALHPPLALHSAPRPVAPPRRRSTRLAGAARSRPPAAAACACAAPRCRAPATCSPAPWRRRTARCSRCSSPASGAGALGCGGRVECMGLGGDPGMCLPCSYLVIALLGGVAKASRPTSCRCGAGAPTPEPSARAAAPPPSPLFFAGAAWRRCLRTRSTSTCWTRSTGARQTRRWARRCAPPARGRARARGVAHRGSHRGEAAPPAPRRLR